MWCLVATSECGYAFRLTFCHSANKNCYAQIISGYIPGNYLLFLSRFSKTLSKQVIRLVDYFVPVKLVIGKLQLLLSVKTVFPIKEYKNFTVKNYENSETFLWEQTKMVELSRFLAFPWSKLTWIILSLILLWHYSLLSKFLIQRILNELKKQSTIVFLWISKRCLLAQRGEKLVCDFLIMKLSTLRKHFRIFLKPCVWNSKPWCVYLHLSFVVLDPSVFLWFEPVKFKFQNGNETARTGNNKEKGSF